MIKVMFLLVFILQILISPVYAENYNALRKFGRGVTNIVLSCAEVPRQMIKVKEEVGQPGGDIAGLFYGTLRGVGYWVGRTCIGVYELTTFMIPSYKPVVEPEFIFSDQEEEQ